MLIVPITLTNHKSIPTQAQQANCRKPPGPTAIKLTRHLVPCRMWLVGNRFSESLQRKLVATSGRLLSWPSVAPDGRELPRRESRVRLLRPPERLASRVTQAKVEQNFQIKTSQSRAAQAGLAGPAQERTSTKFPIPNTYSCHSNLLCVHSSRACQNRRWLRLLACVCAQSSGLIMILRAEISSWPAEEAEAEAAAVGLLSWLAERPESWL